MMPNHIYLDHGATTPLHPLVFDSMLPWLQQSFANPSSLYGPAREARQAIERSRATVADILGCRPAEVTFTSGGTESVNAALRGIALAQQRARSGTEIVTTTIEHQAVLHTCQSLEHFGFATHLTDVDSQGRVLTESIEAAIGPKTALVSVMLANNEVGTIEPLSEIARAARGRGAKLGKQVLVHTDAIAAAGQLPLDVNDLAVDALSLAAHKFGGPKGAGILYLRRAVPFTAQQTGGGQEHQRRAGTENVAAIVGTARALELATEGLTAGTRHMVRLRDRLISGVLQDVPGAALNGHPSERLAGNASFRLADVNGEDLLAELDQDGIAASSGSACADASWEPSHVVLAMGYTMAEAAGSVRFTLGRQTTEDEIDYVVARLPAIVSRLRLGTPALTIPS
jgi:cysteine desulfurase